MNKKAQVGIGAMLIAAVLVIVGLVFFAQSNVFVGTLTKTSTSVNVTMTLPAIGATSELTMCGQKVIGDPEIINASSGTIMPTSNYTITQAVSSTDGYLVAKITPTLSSLGIAGQAANITCNYEPKGYISNSGGRSIALLIPIFFALLIAAIALVPTLRSGVMDLLGR